MTTMVDQSSAEIPQEIVNPLKRARLEIKMTAAEFATIAGVHQSAIGQAEEGFYGEPLPSYLIALGINPGSGRAARLTAEYKEYQLLKRRRNGPLFGVPRLSLNPRFSSDEHPLLSWRKQSSLATFTLCSCYCLHMPMVNKFEKHIDELKDIPPTPLLEALKDAGYDSIEGLLEEFVEACQIFKLAQGNRIRILNNLPPVG